MTNLFSEPAAFTTTEKDPDGTVHLRTLDADKMVCGKRRGKGWIGIPTTWERCCEQCFGAIAEACL